jgi:acyl-coenzyme A thioesterase PaaI-like protein
LISAFRRSTLAAAACSSRRCATPARACAWSAIIASLGEPGFDWVTSSLNINFLTRPAATDMTALARLIRLGHRTAVGEVELYSEGVADMVAHATANYARPRA